ncbi:MAG: pyridoxal-phosphate dependent enzyme [Bacteroidales bacterium]|nr:pyridoxal-phosphate dependent enzyme [Bacteroidales bacterium]
MKKSDIIEELDWIQNYDTPIVKISDDSNDLYIKKEEAIPFSFGGNKCRIAASYFKEIIEGGYDVVVTYGASSSNLCRVIANMASRYGLQCVIVSPEENYVQTPNSELVSFLGARIVKCSVNAVSHTIDEVISAYKKEHKPYFIYGGGHGVRGTDSYRNVLKQIVRFEDENDVNFDYIFITLATGTSMSGLIIENVVGGYRKRLYGITIAREVSRAKEIMRQSLQAYDSSIASNISEKDYTILGDYRCDGYGTYSKEVMDMIKHQFAKNGINLDATYTGKAFYGMQDYLKKNNIKGKRILFIHTGGTPLFFKNNCRYINEK